MIEFKKSLTGETVTEELLQEFEATMESPLPQDYRQHMLDYNGGIKAKDGFLYYTKYESEEGELVLKSLHHFKGGGGGSVVHYSKSFDFLPKAIDIGSIYGGILSMSLADNDYGHIYMQFSDTDPEKVANSFTEFLEGLEYDE